MPASPLVGPGDGRTVRFQGFGIRYVVTGDQTAGALAVVEHDLAPRALGAPLHTHEREDEISHVLAGRLGVQVGDRVVEASPGDTVVKPRGIPHAFWNPGPEPLRFLELIAPAGFERYFADIAPILDAAGAPDLDALTQVMARYAMRMDFDSMGRLIADHGLDAPAA
jgi:mannose-6-phosphate isomerase-like protein (cupin superfamily)